MTTQKEAIEALKAYGEFREVNEGGLTWYVHSRQSASRWAATSSGGFVMVSAGYQMPYQINGSGMPIRGTPGWEPFNGAARFSPEIVKVPGGALVELVWEWPAYIVYERYMSAASELVEGEDGKIRPKEGSFAAELSARKVAENENIIAEEAKT